MDKHLKLLTPKYFDTKFICIDAKARSSFEFPDSHASIFVTSHIFCYTYSGFRKTILYTEYHFAPGGIWFACVAEYANVDDLLLIFFYAIGNSLDNSWQYFCLFCRIVHSSSPSWL